MKKLFVIIAIVCLPALLLGQATMNVNLNSGTQSFLLDSINNITFTTVGPMPTDSLVAWYPFSGNANDASGHGFNGVDSGVTLTTDRFGVANRAYYFNGTGRIRINGFPANYDNVTACAWIKANKTSNLGYHLEVFDLLYGGEDCPYRLNIIDDSLHFWAENGGKVRDCKMYFTDTLNWHFIVGRRTNNGSDYTYELWVDNILRSTYVSTMVPASHASMTASIGDVSPFWSPRENFFGKIDAVRIYKRALTDIELSTLYSEGQ